MKTRKQLEKSEDVELGRLVRRTARRSFLRGVAACLAGLPLASGLARETVYAGSKRSGGGLSARTPSEVVGSRLVLTNCHLIDGVSDEPRPDTGIIIEDGRIADLVTSRGVSVEKRARLIDCRGGWLLPGLWDAHVHLQFPDITPPKDLTARTIKYGANAIEGLREAGITGIRTAGVDNWVDVAWKRAFASKQYLGPRIFAGGYFITTTAGHGHGYIHTRECDGTEDFSRAVREQIQNGVDHIKLGLSGGIMGPPWDGNRQNALLPEEMDAVFRLCNQRDYKVMCHATNPLAVKEAIKRGAWSIEHGYILDDECIRLMVEKRTIFVPTLSVSHLSPSQVSNEWEKMFMEMWTRQIPPEFFARADAASKEHKKWFQAALKAGVRVAVGSDMGPLKDGALLEMGLWVRDGATPMQAIKAATSGAAEVCGTADELGTIEKGKIADLIVVRNNPLEDINNLRKLQMVFKDGDLVVEKPADRS